MIHFRFRYQVQGGHTHIRVFAGTGKDLTYGKCGDLVMQNDEWQSFRNKLTASASVEYVDETEPSEGVV